MSGYKAQLNPLALDTLPVAPLIDLRPSLKTGSLSAARPPAPVIARPARAPLAEEKKAPAATLTQPEQARPAGFRPRPLSRLRGPESSPSFYVSLSDLMCLLLVFFVLIFSLTEKGSGRVITEEASQALARVNASPPVIADPFPQPTLLSQSLSKGLMGLTSLGQTDPGLAAEPQAILNRELPGGMDLNGRFNPRDQEHHRLLSQVRAETSHIAGLEVAVKGEIVLLRLPEVLLFDPGKADLNPSLHPVLSRLGQVLHNFPQAKIKISGHTDDRPIHTTQFASNWELSGARAAMVARSLAQGGVRAELITIQGMADNTPLLPNVNDYNRARNRRVEVEIEM